MRVSWLERRLPADGQGWGRCSDPALDELRRWAADGWRARFARPLRLPLRLADRAAWPLAALRQTVRFARARALPPARAGRLYVDCVLSGAGPMDAEVWRALHGGRHPLPARAAGNLLTRLGDPAGHRLLADKMATAERLASVGISVPTLRGVIGRGKPIEASLLTAAAAGGDLFVKPRHGYGGKGAFGLAREEDGWRIDGRAVTDWPVLERRLERLAQGDDLLLQDRLEAPPELRVLASDGRGPVLRLATVRAPGEPPRLHSALLTLAVPGRSPRHFLEGALHAPVDPASGLAAAGLMLAAPQARLARLPWNGAPLAGRAVTGFAEATAMVLAAMAAIPALPLVHWDVMPTARGPVLLEGNAAGNWILATLPGAFGLDAGPLPPLLARWLPAESRGEAAPQRG